MMRYTEISTIEQWHKALEGTLEKPAVLFKHSTRCPISAGALEEFEAFLEDDSKGKVDYYFIRVIESRPVSNQIAEDLTVRHESPQIIYTDGKKAKWNASHSAITYSFLTDKLGS